MRKAILGTAALATLIAAWFAPDDDVAVVSPAIATTREAPPRSEPDSVIPQPTAAVRDLHIQPRLEDDDAGDAFARQSWSAPAPLKPPEAAAPQQAQAASADGGPPPLPIQYLGRYTEDGATAYFLQVDGANVAARVGEKINDSYLLDSVDSGTLNIIYLPLHQKQTLVVGDVN